MRITRAERVKESAGQGWSFERQGRLAEPARALIYLATTMGCPTSKEPLVFMGGVGGIWNPCPQPSAHSEFTLETPLAVLLQNRPSQSLSVQIYPPKYIEFVLSSLRVDSRLHKRFHKLHGVLTLRVQPAFFRAMKTQVRVSWEI